MSILTSNIKAIYNYLLGIKVTDPKHYVVLPVKTPSWTEGDQVLLSVDLSGYRTEVLRLARSLDVKSVEAALAGTGWKSSQPLFVPSGSLNPVELALKARAEKLSTK